MEETIKHKKPPDFLSRGFHFLLFSTSAAGRAGIRVRRTPEFVCNRLPVSGVGFAFVTEMVDRLRILIISIHRIGILNQLAQALRILQHWAGAEMILIKWLVIMISLENRALQCVQKRSIFDIAV